MRLDGAMLFVRDLERMTAFYREVLGLQPVAGTQLENWVEFRADGVSFSLHAIPAERAVGIRIDSPPRAREEAAIKLTFAVANLKDTLEKIEQMGLPLLRRPWGATDAVDPEGNVFTLRQRVTTGT